MIEKMSNGDPYAISSREESLLRRRYLPLSVLNSKRIFRSDEDKVAINEYQKRRLVFGWIYKNAIRRELTVAETLRNLIDAELEMDQQEKQNIK
jgi:hypothetical protein